MSGESRVVVIGEVMLDVSLSGATGDTKMRLGGIVHACRALWALGVPYSVAYLAPAYMAGQAEDYLSRHGAAEVRQLGTVIGSPNVIIVQNLEETAHQGYEHLLRDEVTYNLNQDALGWLSALPACDVLLFPGKFDLGPILEGLSSTDTRVHADWANTEAALSSLENLKRPLATLITSTSSPGFLSTYGADPSSLVSNVLQHHANAVILKENRGGARYASRVGASIQVGAQLREVVHSVGVGDAFDATFASLSFEMGERAGLAYAAWVAAEYASTTYPDDFRRETLRCLSLPPDEIVEVPGTRLSWEARKECKIYIAGPDFDYLDTTTIDSVDQSLIYHNFSPRRPVKENGQAQPGSTINERLAFFRADMELLEACQLVVAVYEHDDPGTLVEVGLATGLQKPVILFDPHRRARNPMLLGVPRKVVHSLDALLVEVFSTLGQEVPTA